MNSPALTGRRVLVTRAAHQAGKLSDGLRAVGVEPVEVPVLEIRAPASFDPLDRALYELHHYDWMILTSSNTVRAIEDRAATLGLRLAPPASMKVAAVGDATAAAARKAGLSVTLVPESYVAESLMRGLTRLVSGRRILLARAAVARDVVPAVLRQAGAEVNVVDAYRNVMPEDAPERLFTLRLPRALMRPLPCYLFVQRKPSGRRGTRSSHHVSVCRSCRRLDWANHKPDST